LGASDEWSESTLASDAHLRPQRLHLTVWRRAHAPAQTHRNGAEAEETPTGVGGS